MSDLAHPTEMSALEIKARAAVKAWTALNACLDEFVDDGNHRYICTEYDSAFDDAMRDLKLQLDPPEAA